MRTALRLGIVGCGAVVEHLHLPASVLVPQVSVTALVDQDASRAASLAARFGVPMYFDRHLDLLGRVDAALIATPPSSHAPIASDLLARGTHVLCEKPMAPSTAGCQMMIDAAERGGAILAIAHSRRFHFNLAHLKSLVEVGAFGRVIHISIEDGFAFSWPTQTGYMFHPATASGVLLENGIHSLDLLLWLKGYPENVRYRDDALGGVESNLELSLLWADGTTALLKVSRTATLANRLVLHGEEGAARCDVYEGQRLHLTLPSSKVGQAIGPIVLEADVPQDALDVMAAQLADFAQSIALRRRPRATSGDGLAAIRLVEACYGRRAMRSLPAYAPLPGVLR